MQCLASLISYKNQIILPRVKSTEPSFLQIPVLCPLETNIVSSSHSVCYSPFSMSKIITLSVLNMVSFLPSCSFSLPLSHQVQSLLLACILILPFCPYHVPFAVYSFPSSTLHNLTGQRLILLGGQKAVDSTDILQLCKCYWGSWTG